MITLRLQGSLAEQVRGRLDDEARRRSKPGEAVLELKASTVLEAMRLVAGQVPGMDWELRIRSWRVTVNGALIGQDELDMRLPDRAYVSVAPVLAGDGPSIPLWGKVLLYAVGAYAAGEYLASQIPSIPDTDHLETGRRRTLFSGPVNSVAQGGAVPLIYGRTRVGSTVVSGGITQERPTGGEHASPDEIGLDGARPAGADVDRRDVDRGEEDRLAHLQPGAASRERSVLRVIDLLGEGEIEGLVDGLKSVFVDGVAVEDQNGDRNVEGVSIQERKGLAHNATGQEALKGFDATSTGLTHSREKIVHGTPQVGTVPARYDAARVTLQFPILVEYDEHGNEIATDVEIRIEAGRGGSWSTVLTQTISDLSLDAQEVAWRVDRPEAVTDSQTWQVRVSRLTADSTSTKVRDDVYWQRFAGLRDVKQTYPRSAVIGLVIETDRADSVNVARREYEVKGRKVLVPPASIYDPSTATSTSAATYGSGVWDGTMRRLWTDNPAWIAYDVLTDRRAGLGGVPGMVTAVEKARAWFLELSKHCDELVPAPDSAADMEPRWRFNGTIQRREQARRVIDWLLSACRAGISWNAGGAAVAIDGESDVVASIGNANVVDGDFEYQGLRWQERYSAAAVTWQDPEDEYRSGIELVVDDSLVAKYGYRQKDVAAVGCTSRGQAHRTGLLVLNEQERESETVRFRMALEGMHLRPGDRIQIADQRRFEVRAAFRVKSVDTSTAGRETIALDSESPRLAAGGTIAFGEGETAAVSQAAGEGADVLVTTDVPTGLVPGDLVVNDAATIDWIVTELTERDQLEAVLSARRHDPNKYTSIEQRRMLSPPSVDSVARILAPAAVTLRETIYEDGNQARIQLEVGVRESSPTDHRIAQVRYQMKAPGGAWQDVRTTPQRSLVVRGHDSPLPLVVGQRIQIRARFLGRRRKSDWAESGVVRLDGKTDPLAAPVGMTATAVAGGYRAHVPRPAADDYAYTELYDRPGDPGPAVADVDVTEAGWTKQAEGAVTDFLRTDVGSTDQHRVAALFVDTSGLKSKAREVGVTPLAAVAGAAGLTSYADAITRTTRVASTAPGGNEWQLSGVGATGWPATTTIRLGVVTAAEEARLERINSGGAVGIYDDVDNWADYTVGTIAFTGTGATRRVAITLARVREVGNAPALTEAMTLRFTPAGADGADGDGAPERIFAVYAEETIPSSKRPSNSWGYDQPGVADGLRWYDEAQSLDPGQILFVAERDVVGNPSVGDAVADFWSAPRRVGRNAVDGRPGLPGTATSISRATRVAAGTPGAGEWGVNAGGTTWGVNDTLRMGGITAGEEALLKRLGELPLVVIVGDNDNWCDYSAGTPVFAGDGATRNVAIPITQAEAVGELPALTERMSLRFTPAGEDGDDADPLLPPPDPITVSASSGTTPPRGITGGTGQWSICRIGFSAVAGAVGYRIIWTEHWSTGEIHKWSDDRQVAPPDDTIFRSINRGNDDYVTRWEVVVYTIARGHRVGDPSTPVEVVSGPSPVLRVAANSSSTVGGSTGTDAPGSFRAATGNGFVDLMWDESPNVDSWQAQYREQGASMWSEVDGEGDGTVQITGLTNGTAYEFRVRASAPNQGDWSSVVTATPSLSSLVAPPGLGAANPSFGRVVVSWGEVTDATGYELNYGEQEIGFAFLHTVTDGDLQFISTNALRRNFQFRVRAFRDDGDGNRECGPWSATVLLTVTSGRSGPPSAPPNLRATFDSTHMTIAWDTPTDDGGAAITGFNVLLYPRIGTPYRWSGRRALLTVLSENSATTRSVRVALSDLARGGLLLVEAQAANGDSFANVSPTASLYIRVPHLSDSRTWSDWSAWQEETLTLRNDPDTSAAEARGALSRYDDDLITSGSILASTERRLGTSGMYGSVTREGGSSVPYPSTAQTVQFFIPQSLESSWWERWSSAGTTAAQAVWRHRVPVAPVLPPGGGSMDDVYDEARADLVLAQIGQVGERPPLDDVPDIGSGRGTLRNYGLVETSIGAGSPPAVTQKLYVVTTTGFYSATRTLS